MNELHEIDLKKLIENETGSIFNSEGHISCPFHPEKSASMAVKFFPDNNKQKFKCFGCGEAGDAIDFIMKLKGMNYKAAREYLGMENVKSTKEMALDQIKSYIDWQLKNQEKKKGFALKGIFTFVNENNDAIYYKAKFLKPDGKKTSSYYHFENDKIVNTRGCDELPYNFYNARQALNENKILIFVEGEKDANTINSLFKNNGYVATSMKGVTDFSQLMLTGMRVYVIKDTGEAGDVYGWKIYKEYKNFSEEFKFINLPGLKELGDNKDVTDWIEAGHTKEELLKAFKRSLNFKSRYELQQDMNGIFKWFFDKTIEDWNKKYITDFRITEAKRIRFIDEDSEGIKLIFKSCTDEIIEKVGPATVFDDVKSFKNFLGTLDLSFKGKTDDLTELGSWINRFWAIDNEEIHQGVKFIGDDDNRKFITAVGTITNKGIDCSIKADKRNSIEIVEDKISTDELSKLRTKLFKFAGAEKSIPIIGTIINNLAVLQNEELKENLHHLLIVGESGSGKSTILTNVIAAILNFPRKDIKSIGLITSFAFIKDLSNGNYSTLYDEFKPSSLDKYKTQKLSESLRNLYDRTTISRGDKSFRTKDFQLTRPIIMAGEESYPNSETALIERSCIVYVSKRERTYSNTENMLWIIENEKILNKLGRSLIDVILNLSVEDYKKIREEAREKFNDLKNRPLRTAVNIAAGIEILNVLLAQHGLTAYTGYEKFIVANIKEEILEGNEETKSIVEQMIILYNQMLEDGRAGLQTNVVQKRGDKLFIKTSEMINEIHDFVNRIGSAELVPLKLRDFKKQAKKSGYMYQESKVLRIENKTIRYDEYNADRMKELNINSIIEPDFAEVSIEESKIIEGVF